MIEHLGRSDRFNRANRFARRAGASRCAQVPLFAHTGNRGFPELGEPSPRSLVVPAEFRQLVSSASGPVVRRRTTIGQRPIEPEGDPVWPFAAATVTSARRARSWAPSNSRIVAFLVARSPF